MHPYLPFLLFCVVCFVIVGLLLVLFKISSYFGKSDADRFRSDRCPQCKTQKKPHKTGEVRNLVELEMRCPSCGYISWDIPPKTNLSTRPNNPEQGL